MKKIVEHFRYNGIIYFVAFCFIVFIILWPVRNYLNSHYTKDVVCTVTSAKVETWGGGRGGRSRALKIQTEECDDLMVYSNIQRGAGFDEVGRNMKPGTKYIFTINKFNFLITANIVSGIRDSSGGEIDFSPQD